MIYCGNCGTANLDGAVFCSSCGHGLAAPPTVPVAAPPPPPAAPPPPGSLPPAPAPAPPPPAAPAPVEPTIRFVPSPQPRRSTTLWWAVGFVALSLLAGGITYAIVRDDSGGAGSSGSAVSGVDDTGVDTSDAPPTSGIPSSEPTPSSVPDASTTTAAPPDPLSVLEFTRASDAAVVESLVGQWVPQVSAKRPGIEDDGIVYQLADIVALHQQLNAQLSAVLLFSGDYNYQSGDLWVSIVPQGSPTPEGAVQFCIDQGIGRDDCFAKFITHDLSITDTVELQP